MRNSLIIAGWLLCSFYAWGAIMADLDYHDRHEWELLNEHSRDNVGAAAFTALGGPFGAVAVAVYTNFNQHGWELWEQTK